MSSSATNTTNDTSIINLDHGDPVLFESFWRDVEGDKAAITFSGFDSMSYFSVNTNESVCWFMEPKLEEEIKRVHQVVGNAVVDNRYIVVGNGSSQLILAALFALSPSDPPPSPVNVVSAAPYYSSYPATADLLRSRLFKWGGDAVKFEKDGRDEPYIEFITSPNNPDGFTRDATVVNKGNGLLVHDLAYYWPHYTPITSAADHDLMLFTASKCTGHAGSRIGWAIVRDKEVAKKMVKFMEISSIGVSKESQLRAAKILGVVSDSCINKTETQHNFFEYARRLMSRRWESLRLAVLTDRLFTLPDYPIHYCHFTKDLTENLPAFAWIMMKGKDEDCEKVLRERNILSRSGTRFGADPKFVRISMVSKEDEFNLFIKRIMDLEEEAGAATLDAN